MSIRFKHSGQLGDIIYAIPAMQAIAHRQRLARLTLYVSSDAAAIYVQHMKHIGGEQMVSQALFDFIAPLLSAQPYIEALHFLPAREIPATAIDFDAFRAGGVNVNAGNIKDFYFKTFAVLADTPRRWIDPGDAPEAAPYDILIGRSMRYLNQSINYGLLAQLNMRIGFLGLESEFAEFRARFPDLPIDLVPARNALDACRHLAAATLFIGNQSFFFSLAEALQIDRLLEVFEPLPNVVPSGGRSGQFLTTFGLGLMLGTLFSRKIVFSDDDLLRKTDFVLHV
jgi:hypothetical protein